MLAVKFKPLYDFEKDHKFLLLGVHTAHLSSEAYHAEPAMVQQLYANIVKRIQHLDEHGTSVCVEGRMFLPT